MLTILRVGHLRFFFNSREESRRHIHVNTLEGTAKFWLEPIVALADYYGLDEREINKAEKIVQEKQEEFIYAWNQYFQL